MHPSPDSAFWESRDGPSPFRSQRELDYPEGSDIDLGRCFTQDFVAVGSPNLLSADLRAPFEWPNSSRDQRMKRPHRVAFFVYKFKRFSLPHQADPLP